MEQIDIKQQIETMIADEHYRPLSLAQLQETWVCPRPKNSWR